jgi:hypothetical protein
LTYVVVHYYAGVVKVPALPVSGVAQPSVYGVRTVLNRIFAHTNRIEQVVWCNLREEPVIYINERPFVLREFEHALSNLTAYSGMSLTNLEDMEERLKADILAEASRYQGNILVHDELDDECACPMWEAISSESVMTPKEAFFTLQNEGYRVHSTARAYILIECFATVVVAWRLTHILVDVVGPTR